MKVIVNGNTTSIATFDGEQLSDVVGDSRWDGLRTLLNVDSDAELQVKVGRNYVSIDDADDARITANTTVRFVVGGGGKGNA